MQTRRPKKALKKYVKRVGGMKIAHRIFGLPKQTLYSYISGRRTPSPEVAILIEKRSNGLLTKEYMTFGD